jgi:hypothetical protein
MASSVSWLDEGPADLIRQLIDEGRSNREIAEAVSVQYDFPTSEASIRRFRARHGIEESPERPSSIEVDGDAADVTLPAGDEPNFTNTDDLFKEYGLNPEEWEVTGSRISKWGGPDSPRYQMRLNLARTVPEVQIMAPRTDGWIAPPKAEIPREGGEVVVIVGDQQAPFYDPILHQLFCNWLRVNQPNRGVSLGDSYDFPDIRPGHRVHPKQNAKVNECLQSGYDMFRGYVTASPNTRWTKLFGNHDDRFKNVLLDKPSTREFAEWKRPDTPESEGEVLHDLAFAGRLDELGIECIDTGGDYSLGQVNLSKHLAVRHGWIARNGSGASALATLQSLRYSVVVGHTHRQSIVYHTSASIDGEINTLTAAEAGCMCRVAQLPDDKGRTWPGYTVTPDWQQGFMTATIWPDGRFHLTPAVFVDGTLLYGNQRYEA